MNDYDADVVYVACEARILMGILSKLAENSLETRIGAVAPGVSRHQIGLLHILHMHPHTISELSRKLLLDPSTLVPVVDALERKGYLERGSDPNDRRRTPLMLTAEGVKLLESIPHTDENDVLAHSLRALGEDHMRQLLTLLREMMRHMPNGEDILHDVAVRLQHFRECQIARERAGVPSSDDSRIPTSGPLAAPSPDPVPDQAADQAAAQPIEATPVANESL